MEAFETLKAKLESLPVLALPRRDRKMFVDTDDFDRQGGCVLVQVHYQKSVYSIGYWSRTPTPVETRYDTTKRKCPAVVWAMPILHPCLERN